MALTSSSLAEFHEWLVPPEYKQSQARMQPHIGLQFLTVYNIQLFKYMSFIYCNVSKKKSWNPGSEMITSSSIPSEQDSPAETDENSAVKALADVDAVGAGVLKRPHRGCHVLKRHGDTSRRRGHEADLRRAGGGDPSDAEPHL